MGDHQYGFKDGHSTDLCVFVLKEVISFYSNLSSPIYACFIDASKAFDRVNHWILFDKMLKRGIPKIVVRILMTWYTTQAFSVKWGNCVSVPFYVTNGVRQGGVLSPILFNLFIEDLSTKLSSVPVGCYINGVCYNHLNYADDCVILAPSPKALQTLLDECSKFAEVNDMVYNGKKSLCMAFYPKNFNVCKKPTIYLGTIQLKWVTSHKYLGVLIDEDLKDNVDMKRQMKAFYSRGNILVRKFKSCTTDVKLQLFKTYFSSVYAGHLWSNYSTVTYNKVKVAYNNVFRSLMCLSRDCSISNMFVQYNVRNFEALLRVHMGSFISRIVNSTNQLVSNLIESAYFTMESKLLKLWFEKAYA